MFMCSIRVIYRPLTETLRLLPAWKLTDYTFAAQEKDERPERENRPFKHESG